MHSRRRTRTFPRLIRRRNRIYAHSFLRQLKRRLAEVESEKEEYVPPDSLRGRLAPSYHGASNGIV